MDINTILKFLGHFMLFIVGYQCANYFRDENYSLAFLMLFIICILIGAQVFLVYHPIQ